MGATPAQIASAQALAKSRGYNPSLVDADNADRANTAFPTQAKANPMTAPTPTKATPVMAAATPPSNPSPLAPAAATAAGPMGSPTGGAPTTPITPAAASPAVNPNAQSAMAGITAATGGSSMGNSNYMAPGDPYGLRPGLSTRMMPMESMALAGMRKAY